MNFKERETTIRDDSTKKQRASLRGQSVEQLAPLLPGFPYDPTEAHFLGDPVDFVIFGGRSPGVCDQVLFPEVKTGTSSLTSIQRRVRDAIAEGQSRMGGVSSPGLGSRRGEGIIALRLTRLEVGNRTGIVIRYQFIARRRCPTPGVTGWISLRARLGRSS